MTKIKCIFSDLDFTLLDQDLNFSACTQKILNRIMDSGIRFIPCSSRCFSEYPDWIHDNDRIRYMISSNGSCIYDKKENRQIYSRTFPVGKVKQILKDLDPILPYWSVTIGGILYGNIRNLDDRDILGMDEMWLDYFLHEHRIENGMKFLDRMDPQTPAEKIEFVVPEGAQQQRNEVLHYLENSGLMVSSSYQNNIEITHPEATKGNAVKWMMEYFQISADEAIAAGDNSNDITMLQQVTHSIAVDNAIESVKKIARHHADRFDQDGAARKMQEIIFNEKEDR